MQDVFVVYNGAERNSVYLMVASCSLFWLAFFLDVISSMAVPVTKTSVEKLVREGISGHKKLRLKSRLLLMGRTCCFLGGSLVFGLIVALSSPNYLEHTHLSEICPFCGAEFNAAVMRMSQFSIGLVFAGL